MYDHRFLVNTTSLQVLWRRATIPASELRRPRLETSPPWKH